MIRTVQASLLVVSALLLTAPAIHAATTPEQACQNGRYAAVGRRIETPLMNMTYRTTRGPMFEKGVRPPNRPYIRGFDK